MTQKTKILDKNTRLAVTCAGVVVFMLGMSYAAVPLYQIFCQVTGYGGTTQAAEAAPDVVLSETMTVRFDANTSRDMGWQFKPVQHEIKLKIGENKLAFYEAINPSKTETTGTATFNVTPQQAGAYFNKIECFCFTEQSLKPGERVEMPVSFFIDTDIVKDPELKSVRTITLSYTFFPVKREAKLEAGQKPGQKIN